MVLPNCHSALSLSMTNPTWTIETTWREIGALLDNFTPKECANYLANSGYASG